MSKTKKILLILTVVLGLMLAALAGGVVWYKQVWYPNAHVFVEDAVYPRDSTHINLRGTGISLQHYEALRQQLPDCEILWDLPFQGGFLPDDTRELTLSTLSDADVELLDYLTELKTVDATACRDYAQIFALRERRPEMEIRYQVEIGGELLAPNTTSLAYDGEEPEAAELLENLAWLPDMKQIHFVEPKMAAQDLVALREAYPNITVTWEKTVMGNAYPDDVKEFDFSGIKLETVDEIEAALAYFPDLEKVQMHHCGIDNETMAAFRERARGHYQVIWTVTIYTLEVRTDDVYFMPGKTGVKVPHYLLDDLIYCEGMICVDVGHGDVRHCEWVKGMPNLKYLILADTNIRNIEPLSTCKNLIYLELLMSQVQDVTPLQGCTALQDLCVADTVCEVTPLAKMPWLKNLWVNMNHTVKPDVRALLTESLPDTHIVFDCSWPTGDGWRQLQNYYDMRDIVGMPYFTW